MEKNQPKNRVEQEGGSTSAKKRGEEVNRTVAAS